MHSWYLAASDFLINVWPREGGKAGKVGWTKRAGREERWKAGRTKEGRRREGGVSRKAGRSQGGKRAEQAPGENVTSRLDRACDPPLI